jgi:hypothetical protein
MKRPEFFQQVRERFSYLMDDFGFSVIHEEYYPQSFGNALVVLESKDCRIRVLLEKEQVLVDVGPLSAPEEWSSHAPDYWFGLTYVTALLAPEAEPMAYQFPDTSLDRNARIDRQLVRLAGILRPYCDQIARRFCPESFQSTQEELLQLQEKQVREWLRETTRED